MYFGPIYLHFLNRELLRSVNIVPRFNFARDLLLSGLFSSGKFVAPLAALVEGHAERPGLESDILTTLIEFYQLEIASDEACLEDFLERRRELYKFDQDRYPVYFSEGNPPSWMAPQIFIRISATKYLEKESIVALDAVEETNLQLSKLLSADERKCLLTSVLTREHRALTMSLFDSLVAPKSVRTMGRFLSQTYIKHYSSILAADFPTGLHGLQVFDEISQTFPLLDTRIAKFVLNMVSAHPLVALDATDNPKALLINIAAVRGTASQLAVVRAFQELISRASNSRSVVNRPKPAVREIVSARIMKAASKTSWPALTWNTGDRHDIMQQLASRIKTVSDRLAIHTRHFAMLTDSSLDHYPKTLLSSDLRQDEMVKHVFISYVRDDSTKVDALSAHLQDEGIEVWQDRSALQPGQRWRAAIRRAISEKAFAFIACFSKNYERKDSTYMNEELVLALEEIRKRSHERTWFIPIRLDETRIPDRYIGGGETLGDIQNLDLFPNWDAGCARLITVLRNLS